MAIIRDPLFEKLSGRLGDYVFKQINGKTFVYYRPKAQKNYDYSDDTEETHKTPVSLLTKFLKKNNRKQ